jgi:formylglycine-generating enzyme required for sulfatase activity
MRHCLRGAPMLGLVLFGCLLLALPASALELDFAPVHDAGNPDDDTGHGRVAYDYAISTHEITNADYTEFLNAVANETDESALYNPAMPGIAFPLVPIGFERFYEVVPGYANLPVDHVSIYDAFRFANWLQGGQLSGTAGIDSLVDGAYRMQFSRTAIARNPGALFFVPNTDEWYKAAYYDPTANGGAGGYFAYPTATDTPPTCALPSANPNTANCESVVSAFTEVGAYPGSPSPYGTFDQGGNAWEWTEQTDTASIRVLRGGSWFTTATASGASMSSTQEADGESIAVGFRIAMRVPEPGHGVLAGTAGLVLAALRARRDRRVGLRPRTSRSRSQR